MAIITTMSLMMLSDFGLSDAQTTMLVGWLALPWMIKPLWSPFIDSVKTKRWWILATQLFMGAGFACVALLLPTAWWLQGSLALLFLMAFSSATHDVAADGMYIIGLNQHDQSLYVGLRNTFYRLGMILCQGLLVSLAGLLQRSMQVDIAWSIVFLFTGSLLLLLFLWHTRNLPKVEEEPKHMSLSIFGADLAETFVVFAKKPHLISALLFMSLFRLPEGQLDMMAKLFLKADVAKGGLGMGEEMVGLITGTIGVIGLLLGGIVGGYLVSRDGLKRWVWPLVLSLSLPDFFYVYLSMTQNSNVWLVGSMVFVEQLGYGLGFTVATLFLVSFAAGRKSTSVFSICTAVQFIGLKVPGMLSGAISDHLGYVGFFWWVMACCLVTFVVTALIYRNISSYS